MYPHQRERLTEALAAHGAAALVGTTPANVAYLTGFRSLSRLVDPEACALAVMAPAGTALVIPTIDAPTLAESDATADHVVPYGPFVFAYAREPGEIGTRVREWTTAGVASPGAALAAVLDALGAGGDTIALDEAGLSAVTAREVATALAGRTVVDGAPAWRQARQVKGPWEIEALERALGIAEEALNAVVQVLKPGASEREAVDLFEAEVRRRGATPCRPLITFGSRTALSAVAPSERTLRNGELVRLDVGCVRQGYHAAVTRTAVVGEPDARQESVFDALSRGLDAAIAAVKPGVTAGNVFAATVAAVRAAGLAAFDRHHVGHGIGLDAREAPVLEPHDPVALEAGMVLGLETPYYEHGWGGVHVKDTVLVTRSGARVMNRSQRGLLVLG